MAEQRGSARSVSWRPGRVYRGLLSILAGSSVGQGVILLSSPLLTRLYDLSDFGVMAVFAALVSIMSMVTTAGLDSALTLPEDEREARAVAWCGMYFAVAMALLLFAVASFAGAPIAAALGTPALDDFWWLLAVTLFALGVSNLYTGWLLRHKHYRGVGIRNILQGVGQSAPQIGIGLADPRPAGLLLGIGLGRLAGSTGVLSRAGFLRGDPVPTVTELRRALSRYRRFPLVTSWSMLLNGVGLHAPVLVVAAAYGDVTAGLFGLTIRVVSGPASLVGQATAGVFAGEAAALVRERRPGLAALVRGTALRLLLLGVIPSAVLVLFGPPLFGLVFGEEWTEAGRFAQVLAIGLLAQLAVSPVARTLLVLEHQGLQIASDGLRLALTIGGPVVCALAGTPELVAIIALSGAYLISYLLLFLLCRRSAVAADRRMEADVTA